MTHLREYIISDERKAELDNEAAIADAKAALTAAGYRILGPDELDPVTVEKAAAIAEATQAYGDPVDASVGLGPIGKRIVVAIRALGRKS